jgi:hypothetical protein
MEKVLGKSVESIFFHEIENGTGIEFLKKLIPDLKVEYNKNPKFPLHKKNNVMIFNDMIKKLFGFFFFCFVLMIDFRD